MRQNLIVFYAFVDSSTKPYGLFDKCALLQKTGMQTYLKI